MVSCKKVSPGNHSVTKDTVTTTGQSLDVYHPYFYDSAFVALRVLRECPTEILTKDYKGWADIRPSYRQNWIDRLNKEEGLTTTSLTVQEAYHTCVFSTAWTTALEFCSQIFGCSSALGDPTAEAAVGRDKCLKKWQTISTKVTVSDQYYQDTCNDIYGISASQ